MDNLLIIVDLGKQSGYNLLNSAIGSQNLPKGVRRLSDNSFLIDARTSLAFFAALSNACVRDNLQAFVLPVPDGTHLELFPQTSHSPLEWGGGQPRTLGAMVENKSPSL